MGGVSRGPSSKSPVWGALDPLSGGRGSFLELLSLASGGTPGPPGSQAEVEVQRALTLISPFLVGLGRRPWHLFSGSSVPSLEAGSKVPYHREAPGSENPQTTFSTFPGGEWVCGLGGAQADSGGWRSGRGGAGGAGMPGTPPGGGQPGHRAPPGLPHSLPEPHMGRPSPQMPKPLSSQRMGFTGLREVFRDASCQKQPWPPRAPHCVWPLSSPCFSPPWCVAFGSVHSVNTPTTSEFRLPACATECRARKR